MARLKPQFESNQFFGIGIANISNEVNIGTLWRSAYILGASFIFTVGKKYHQQGSDVFQVWTKIPLYHYLTIANLKANLPYSTRLIGVELVEDSVPLVDFKHPERAAYLLGSEQHGLTENILKECHSVVSLPGNFSLNVAVTGSILLYDRVSQIPTVLPKSVK